MQSFFKTALASVSLALLVVVSGCGHPPNRSNVVSAHMTSPRETTHKLAAPKDGRARHLVVVLADNEGTETTDFVIPYGVLKESGAVDVFIVSTGPRTVMLNPALLVRADMTLAQFDTATPAGADVATGLDEPDCQRLGKYADHRLRCLTPWLALRQRFKNFSVETRASAKKEVQVLVTFRSPNRSSTNVRYQATS